MSADKRTLEEMLAQKRRISDLQDVRQQQMVRAWARAWDEINAELQRTITQMMAEAENGTPLVSRARRLRHQRTALRLVSDRLRSLLDASSVMATADAERLIRLAGSDTWRLLQQQLPTVEQSAARATVTLQRVDADQIEQIVERSTQQITAEHLALSREADRAMRRELTRALAVGDNPREAARRMVAAVQGEFDGGLARALVIARTEQVDAYRAAAKAQQDANSDVLRGWQWVCTLSARSCPSCVSHHGEIHPLSEPGPQDHHQGRCARLPLTKSWAELGFKGIKEPKPALRPGDGLRWLNQQPPDVQRQVLGSGRYAAWKAGDYPPSRWSVKRSTPGWRDSWGVGPIG